MTQELATTAAETSLAISRSMLSEDDTKVEAKDLVLPKILLMQGLSDAVAEGKATVGQIRESLENKLLADKDKALEFIPFNYFKSWIIFEKQKGAQKFEYVAQVPYTEQNGNWLREEILPDGKEVQRNEAINVYCILPSEISEGTFLPYLISFRRTSFLAGKRLLTFKTRLLQAKNPDGTIGRAWASQVFKLSSASTKNDKGTFFVFEVTDSRRSTPEEIAAVYPWFQMSKTQSIKVDDSDLEREAASTTAPGKTEQNVAGGGIAY